MSSGTCAGRTTTSCGWKVWNDASGQPHVVVSRRVKLPSRLCLLLLAGAACQAPGSGHPSREWNGVIRNGQAGGEERAPSIVSDLELRPYLPPRVLGRLGGSPQGSVTRIGPRSISEVTRDYSGPEGRTELKLADARFEPHATDAIRSMAQDGAEGEAQPLVLPGAIGYSNYDEDQRVARAQVVIGGRFIASATVQQAQDAQVAAAALRSLDTLALSRLASESN